MTRQFFRVGSTDVSAVAIVKEIGHSELRAKSWRLFNKQTGNTCQCRWQENYAVALTAPRTSLDIFPAK